jgi:hypothetical protein
MAATLATHGHDVLDPSDINPPRCEEFVAGSVGGLPEFDPVSLRISDPPEFADAVEILSFGPYVGPEIAKLRHHGVQITDSKVEHGLLGARSEVVGVDLEGRENGGTHLLVPETVLVGLEAETLSVPGAQGRRICGTEKVSTDSNHTFHDRDPARSMGCCTGDVGELAAHLSDEVSGSAPCLDHHRSAL